MVCVKPYPQRMVFRECPLCQKGYSQLSQHLTVTHKVCNKEERKLLLAIPSGRVDVRIGVCPVDACGKSTTRMDRHLVSHKELKAAAQKKIFLDLKRRKVIESIVKLRATNPVLPVVSTPDLKDQVKEGEEEECMNQRCRERMADLSQQVNTQSEALRVLTQHFRMLQRRVRVFYSGQVSSVTGRVLSGAEPVEEEEPAGEGPQDQPLTPQPSGSTKEYPFHVFALNSLLQEFKGHEEGTDPTPRMVSNVALKIYWIKKFLGFNTSTADKFYALNPATLEGDEATPGSPKASMSKKRTQKRRHVGPSSPCPSPASMSPAASPPPHTEGPSPAKRPPEEETTFNQAFAFRPAVPAEVLAAGQAGQAVAER